MHYSNTETTDFAHTNGYFLDTRSKKDSEKRIYNSLHNLDTQSAS